MSERELAGQRALVTGASTGIGAACAKALAEAGADVVLTYHSSEKEAQQVAAVARQSGQNVLTVQGDIAQPEDCARIFETVDAEMGGLDILIANAGIQRDAAFLDMSLEDWQRVLDVNLTGQFMCAQLAARRFMAVEPGTGASAARGKIIFTSSVHQAIPWAGHVNYATAKGGIKLLMQSMAQELAAEKIRVNAIAPGAIKTDINREAWESKDARERLLKLIPYGRVGEPADIGKAAVWLASDQSDYVVGTTLFVDGGMMLYPSFREEG